MIKGVLLDLSGTVYVGEKLLPRAFEALRLLHEEQMPLRYITNSSRCPHRSIVANLQALGINLRAEEVFTAPQAVRNYLHEHRLSPWLLIHPALEEEFAEFRSVRPDAVVLGDAAAAFTYANLNQAFRLLQDGARLLAVGDNRYFKEEAGMSLDAGPFVRALEYAAGCEAIILGKPSPAFFHAAASQLGCQSNEVLMVGDDVFSDINGALRSGMKAALVKTGKYRCGDESYIAAPGACVCEDLFDAVAGVVGQDR